MAVAVLYVLICLVVYRLTRLVLADTVPPLGWLRERVLNWLEPEDVWLFLPDGSPKNPQPVAHLGGLGRSLRYLLTCPWCMSAWVGAATVYVFTLCTSVPLPWAVWIAASAVTGYLSIGEDRLTAPVGENG